MSQYLLSIYQPYGESMDEFPDADFLEPIVREVTALKEDMHRAGVWVFDGGLHAPSTATVLRAQGDGVVTTDGPFAEAKEHLGGFTVVDVPDLDAALEWGGRLARATTLPVEVRPFQEG
ncbi:MAG TPA: YciI family protein [Phototrophicaceae bacterium]|nr:YciI family protein [Phototrophicaceae bacterium]